MNIMKKSIVILMIFALLTSISLISRAENIIEDKIPDINNMDIDTEDSIDDSLEDILSKHGITNELDQIQEEILSVYAEIEANDYNLNIPRYVDTSDEEPEIDLAEVTAQIKGIDKEIGEVSAELKKSFDELGLEFPF